MNWKRNSISLILLVAVFGILTADNGLNIYLDATRLLTPDGYTRFEVTYKVPYSELLFTLKDGVWLAQLVTTAYLEQNGARQVLQTGTNWLQTKEENTAVSNRRSFTDKVTVTLSTPMRFILEVRDGDTGKTKTWETDVQLLNDSDLISDPEFAATYAEGDSSGYPQPGEPESLRDWKRRFTHDGIPYRPSPDHVYDMDSGTPLSLYLQGFHYTMPEDDFAMLRQTVDLRNESGEGVTLTDTLYIQESRFSRFFGVQPGKLAEGRYNLTITLEDLFSGKKQTRSDFVLVQVRKMAALRVFPALEDEFKLLRILDPALSSKDWNAHTEEGKLSFINWFWARRDPSPDTPSNESFEEIRNRVAYSNENFSMYGIGWQSDRGKVYIEMGTPDEIQKGTTTGSDQVYGNDSSEEPRAGNLGTRDWQVWKYYTKGRQASYLFLDTQTSGNYRLLLKRENGRDDVRFSNWERLMGSDFDTSLLD